MFESARNKWEQLKRSEPGHRFEDFHRSQPARAGWRRVLYLALAVLLFAAGIVFAFIPGPAVLFFALCGAVLAQQSLWVAKHLDQFELWLRHLGERVQQWWRHRHAH